MENPKVENFHLYGKWRPCGEAVTQKFLDLLKLGDLVTIQVSENGLVSEATVGHEIDEDYIDVVMRN